MRVLDLGCGLGDVAFLAGEWVGPSGSVLGIDRSAEAIATAKQRMARAINILRFVLLWPTLPLSFRMSCSTRSLDGSS